MKAAHYTSDWRSVSWPVVVTDVPLTFTRAFGTIVWAYATYHVMLDMFGGQAWVHYGCTGNFTEYPDTPNMIKWTMEEGYKNGNGNNIVGQMGGLIPTTMTPEEVQAAIAEAREAMEKQMRADGNLSYLDGALDGLSECVRL